MTSMGRWLQSLCWMILFAALTMSCQVLFGEFKVSDGPSSVAGQGGVTGTGGAPSGGGNNAQTSGPIRVVPTSDLFTSDLGAQDKFYVSLSQKPTANVSISVASSNKNEGTVSPESLLFTTEDWNAPQAVTVTGVYDSQAGNQRYSVLLGPAVSADKVFANATATVSIVNIDNDSAGIFVTPTQGLETSESPPGQASFTVVLTKAPSAEVVIALSSNDESAGTVAPSSLTFTPDTWNAPRTVTITGVDNGDASGNRPYEIIVGPVTSLDDAFATLPLQKVSVTNLDNDYAGVMVTLSTGIDPSDPKRLRTSEKGESATFTVSLNTEPLKDVTLTVSGSSDEGTVTPTKLTFTATNWNSQQTVTVVGANDNIADGNQPYQVNLGSIQSDDPAYGNIKDADLPAVNLINIDDDKADLAVTLLSGVDPKDASLLQTSESGDKAQFSVVLTSKPQFPVHFELNSTNTNEGKISLSALDFTEGNWNKAQTVTVTGVGDDTKDGNVSYAVRISAPTTDDLDYQKLPSTDVKVVNIDDDVAGITTPKLLSGIDGGTKLITREPGESAGTATFSISLTSRPKKEVKVPVASSDSSEGKVSPTTLTFTPSNYSTAQTVTVVGVDDLFVDGNQAYTVNIGPTTSDDTDYVGLTQSVKVTNQDDDSAYIVCSPNDYKGTTTEQGGSASFSLSLHSQPSVDVTLTFTSDNMNEGKVSPGSLKYTTSNWATPQTVVVTGVNDDAADGDKSYNVAVKGTNTTDKDYQYAATTLSLTNKDDDVASMKVTAAANLQTTEAGGKVTFTVVLTSQPSATVNVAVSSSAPKEGTVSSGTLSFTTGNWATAQTVTVTGVDDSVADGNQTYTVTLKTSGNDSKYTALGASTVTIVNKDDDVVGITVAPTTCATTPTTTATFTVVLKSQPLGPVSVALSSDTPTEGKVSPSTLSFTASTWNVAQQVTVTGQDDGTTSTMTSYKIVTAAAVSTADAGYNGFNASDVACVNTTPAPPDPPPNP